jgi:hypothetical protein
MNDEEKEERFYKPEAKNIWDKFRDIFNEFIPERINGKAVSELKKEHFSHREINIDSLKISRKNPDSFSKLIYLLTLFLDGKEINDLLTTLINKFDNISSFISIMKEMNISCDFTDEYRFFNKSKYICSELRLINSFARMTSPVSLAKREMYREAVEILGTAGMNEDEKESLLDKVLCIDGNGKYISSKTDRNRDVNLRNFIANNVIESSRFKYLIRYNNAKKTRVLASNKTVVRFLLERIDELNEKQIDRYYETCSSDKTLKNKKDKIDFLTELIIKIDCSQFLKVKNRVRAGTAEAQEKERLKAVVGLYLTIMYIITKNMVYVNSRYVTAFHCLERDRVLLNAEKGDYCALTSLFLASENNAKYALGRNKRASIYIKHNCGTITKDFLVNYRNAIAHLSVVRNMESYISDIKYVDNYFALYHYTMQRWLFDQKAVTDQSPVFLKKYNNNLNEYHTYCKDFVKALNVPFAYNLARYKNLSIAELFDMNDTKTESSAKFGNEAIPVE